MRVKVRIPKVRCIKTTKWEWGKDEIYYAMLAVFGKTEEGKFIPSKNTPIYSNVSEIKNRVKKGAEWDGNDHIIDVDDDVTDAIIYVALYEEDLGGTYKELKKGFEKIITPNGVDWNDILKKAGGIIGLNNDGKLDIEEIASIAGAVPNLTNPTILGGFLISTTKIILKGIAQDDLIDNRVNHYHFVDRTNFKPSFREHNYSGHGGRYDVQIHFELVKE